MPVLDWVNSNVSRNQADLIPLHVVNQENTYGDPIDAKSNLLVHGDNLIALKALLPFYSGRVKCIYIDPPYNTGNAFEHYDDNLENSQWLSLMYPRIKLLRDFLRDDGSIWVQIDDDQFAYLKVLMDEIFGRDNFITSICVKMSHLSGMKMSHKDKKIPKIKEFILIYAKNKANFILKPVYVPAKWNDVFSRYTSYLVKDKISPMDHTKWSVIPLNKALKENGINPDNEEESTKFCLTHGDLIFRTARNNSEAFRSLPNDDKFRKIETASGLTKYAYKREEVIFTSDRLRTIDGALTPVSVLGDIWTDIGINNLHNEGGVEFKNGKKPEKLVRRVLEYCTEPGDYVLDSFLGSGTTAAVSLKMRRKFIGIEMGNQAITHCIPRILQVIAGDQGGISKHVNWNGGGGFSYYELGESIFDKFGSINPKVNFKTLAAYIWQKETGTPTIPDEKPILGSYKGTSIFLLYNGVLSDLRPEAGNILNRETLKYLENNFPFEGEKIIYADAMTGISTTELKVKQITFKQIPYDINS